MIVSGLVDPYYRELCGPEYDTVARGVIGMFRRAYMTLEPPDLARRVFEFGMTHPLFRTIWNEANVAETFTEQPAGVPLRLHAGLPPTFARSMREWSSLFFSLSMTSAKSAIS